MTQRKVVQLFGANTVHMMALCDDGTIWRKVLLNDDGSESGDVGFDGWKQFPSVPQDVTRADDPNVFKRELITLVSVWRDRSVRLRRALRLEEGDDTDIGTCARELEAVLAGRCGATASAKFTDEQIDAAIDAHKGSTSWRDAFRWSQESIGLERRQMRAALSAAGARPS